MDDDIVTTVDEDNNEWQVVQRLKSTRQSNKSNKSYQLHTNINNKTICKVAPLAPLISTVTNDSPWLSAAMRSKVTNNTSGIPHDRGASNYSYNKQYYRLREVSGVIGFVVNIHDAINFDIDLQLTAEMKNKYGNVIINEYTYNDLGDFGSEYLTNLDHVMNQALVPQNGVAYRCRLRGIGINQLPPNIHMTKSYAMITNVKQLIDRTDSWVSCTLCDIDVYHRLLVDIFVHTTNECINIRDYLLQNNNISDEVPLFYEYKRDNKVKVNKWFINNY